MNFKLLGSRNGNLDRAFGELETDLADAFDESLGLDDLSPLKSSSVSDENLAARDDGSHLDDVAERPGTKPTLTSHTQSRLAALSSFDELFNDAQEYLKEINAKLSEVTTSHHLTRGFFNILHADIHRANDLELANVSLADEQRMLSEQLHDTTRKLREREGAVEALLQRETGLAHDKEALRVALAAARLDLVEAANTNAMQEAELGDLAKTLSAKTIDADRRSHENEMLREKHISLSIDLDKTLKREAEARRRLDELSNIHTKEAARTSELLASLGKSEKEELRLEKALETAQAKLSEMTEAARIVEGDREAEVARSLAEMRGLRSEIQNLQSRLELASLENREVSSEIAKLKVQWRDAVAEKQVADERWSALMKENESDKDNLSKVSANFSQLSLQQAAEQIQLDIQRQECEDLRTEIGSLNARIKELLPYERLHKVTNARQPDNGVVEVAGAAAETGRASSRRRVRPSLRATS